MAGEMRRLRIFEPERARAELVEGLDRHFLAGCPALSTNQLHEHQAMGYCPDCRERATMTATASADISGPRRTPRTGLGEVRFVSPRPVL